ncbi:MAG: hypothetical protein VW647_10145 [Alphaproteobacteria bacterium]
MFSSAGALVSSRMPLDRTKVSSNAGDCRYRLAAMMARKGA